MWHQDIISYLLRKMKIRVFYLLSLVLIFTFSSAVFVSQYYEAYAVFENNMSISEPIDYKHADSLVRCAMSCSLGCQTLTITIMQDCASHTIHAMHWIWQSVKWNDTIVLRIVSIVNLKTRVHSLFAGSVRCARRRCARCNVKG